MWTRITKQFKVGGSNRCNGNKMPEVNSTSVPSLVDFDVTHLSEEEISTLREVLEREWVLQEENTQKKRKLNQEMMQLEETISQRSHGLSRKALSEMCNVCFKVKVATTGALVCERCRKKTCIRCGKRDQGVWRCALCLKIRQSLMFTGAWYHDVSPCERFQVQEMLNRLAEESVRRLEMHSDSSRGEASVRISSSPENLPLLHHPPPTYPELQVTKTLYLPTSEGKREASVHDLDIENEDDDVFEDNDEEIDKYLSFPHEEDQFQQRDGWEESYSSVHHSSLDDDSCSCESQGASGGTPEGNQSPMENMPVDDQSRRRKVGGLPISKHGDCPMIHKMNLRKDPKLQRLEMGSDYELFGIEVVGGRMCTGGFLCVYVAKVVKGSSAVQCIREGDQILEWDHTSLMDVSFEKAKRIVAASPPEVTLVICHNAASFMKKPRTPTCGILTKAVEKKRKRYDSIKCWSRWSLAQLTDDDYVFDEGENQTQGQRKIGQIQLHIWHDPHGNNMTVRVLNARGLSLQFMPNQELINPYALLYLLPNREISSHFRTNTDPETVTPKWDLSFVFSNIPESELPSRTLEVTLWSEVPGDTNIFLGESLIKMTPTLLCSGAQWFDIQDHDEASTFLPVPMRRRHTLSPRLLPPINEVRTYNEEVKNDSSPTGLKKVNRSISTVNISTCVSQVFISESDGITMQHRRRRRADSVVTMKAFHPKRNSNFQRMESFRRRFLDSSYKSRSAPTTPSVSIPQSMEDLRKKRAMTRSTDGLKLPLNLSDYFTSLKSAKENAHEIEFKAKEEREGKMRGALRVMKRYPANFRIRLGKLMEKPCQLGVVAEPGASGSTMSEYHDLPGYLSAPTSPSVSTSTEDLRRERSLTNYLQVPRSPGVFSIFKRRNDSQSSQVCAGNVAEGEEPSSMETQPCFSPRLSPSSNDVAWEVFSPLPTMKETEPHFTFPKPIHDPQFDYVDEEEVTPKERPSRDAYAGDTEAGELGIGNQQPVAPSESLPLDNDDQEPSLNVMDKWEIPRITVHRDSTGDHTLPASADNAPKQEAEPPAGKKGTLHALRKYSRSLRPRLSRDSAAKLTLYGEDPVKGVVGPGQLRRGSYQGHELGYLRIGLFSSRGSLEVEIIRGVSLLVLGDHPPDTYVKTYLIKDQVRLLKRKTSITRQSVNPVYNCKIKYSGCEVHNSELLVSVWCKQGIFGRKVLLGEVHIALGSLNLSVKQVAWYKLFIESQLSDD